MRASSKASKPHSYGESFALSGFCAPLTRAIRTYSATGGVELVPAIASEFGLRATIGAWVDKDQRRNEREIRSVIDLAKRNSNVNGIIVGNETIYRGEQKVPDLIAMIQRVKRATNLPVTTGEIWHVWIEHPELVSQVDYIAAHILPYWEGFSEHKAVDQAVLIYDKLRQAYPGKRIVIAEFGWQARLSGPLLGRLLLLAMWREHRRLRRGHTYEPPTFCERTNQPEGETDRQVDALPEGCRLFIEHKLYEPAFYSTVLNDWGVSYHCVRELGPKAFSLVDLGHHAPNVNIEMIVARLIQFCFVFGGFYNEIGVFFSLIGFSVSINGAEPYKSIEVVRREQNELEETFPAAALPVRGLE